MDEVIDDVTISRTVIHCLAFLLVASTTVLFGVYCVLHRIHTLESNNDHYKSIARNYITSRTATGIENLGTPLLLSIETW